jgi:hypothetical protein
MDVNDGSAGPGRLEGRLSDLLRRDGYRWVFSHRIPAARNGARYNN